ncbi:MAG: glutaredoxin-like protein, YruB-family [archaeon GW2011_AR17]|nr:MAG: glutaredoxin-like protein, YruB-family [archaeon GW2011_AR17]MBS3154194.1 glutaredoxin family protein [Candidatus Woesearchaeota archaeon]HIH14768.1 glutaredoxin family protein [Nanoarchaeota archaeon]HIH58680.1 glutaredoxin family protein [Nanoarchaeota archaeon]HII14468.1 glutaredoxin family protein [Nanoarchaeota archaeon]
MTKEHSITIYSTPICPYCVQLKNYLKEQGFKYTDIDVSRDHKKAEEMIEKSGQMGVPVADIDGQIVIGFNKEKVKKLLSIK